MAEEIPAGRRPSGKKSARKRPAWKKPAEKRPVTVKTLAKTFPIAGKILYLCLVSLHDHTVHNTLQSIRTGLAIKHILCISVFNTVYRGFQPYAQLLNFKRLLIHSIHPVACSTLISSNTFSTFCAVTIWSVSLKIFDLIPSITISTFE